MNNSNTVAIVSTNKKRGYPEKIPFYPSETFPEFENKHPIEGNENEVFPLLRNLMYSMGFDSKNYNKQVWNPLGDIIQPGMKVLVKPNLVRHIHIGGGDYQAVVTHSSLIRAIMDYIGIALKGDGLITVGDAPVQGADFDEIKRKNGLEEICKDVSKTWDIKVNLVDFRLIGAKMNGHHSIIGKVDLRGDRNGYQAVDLGTKSLLFDLADQADHFRVTCYDCKELAEHHNKKTNEYLIPQTVLDADVVINLPKLKTHRKVGMTAALKNLVGINGHKDWLPHHRIGSKEKGGDEYLFKSFLKKYKTKIIEKQNNISSTSKRIKNAYLVKALDKILKFHSKDMYEEGSWYGNDTLWRTVLDLNRILLYADRNGVMQKEKQRKVITIADGIIAGEGEGPMEPENRYCGILIGGTSSVAVDSVLSTLIGFDFSKMPLIKNGFEKMEWPLINFNHNDIKILCDDIRWKDLKVRENRNTLKFKPSNGWKNHIELK